MYLSKVIRIRIRSGGVWVSEEYKTLNDTTQWNNRTESILVSI